MWLDVHTGKELSGETERNPSEPQGRYGTPSRPALPREPLNLLGGDAEGALHRLGHDATHADWHAPLGATSNY